LNESSLPLIFVNRTINSVEGNVSCTLYFMVTSHSSVAGTYLPLDLECR